MHSKAVSIVLVEDDEIDAEWVKRGFVKRRIANPIYHVSDGIEALELLRGQGQYKTSLEPPYLLLVDINMPRMNGIELLSHIRQDPKLKETIAFILTTSDREEDKQMAYDLNVAGYMVKSEVGNQFVEMIELLEHYWKIVELP